MFFLLGSKLFFNNNVSDSKFYINIFNPKNLMNTFYQYDPIKNTNKTLLSNNMGIISHLLILREIINCTLRMELRITQFNCLKMT